MNFPKLEWGMNQNQNEPVQLTPELESELKKDLDTITKKKAVNPHIIQDGLRSINFHKDHPSIYKIIDDMCLDYDLKGKDMNTSQIMDFIIKNLADNKSRNGLNAIFDSLKDPKTGEINAKQLALMAQEIGDQIDENDFNEILRTISGPAASIDINQDEFYYIMTKKPEEALKITMATKTQK